MKVLHLYAGNLYGGIERVLVSLAKYRDFAPEMEPEFGLCFRGQVWGELAATGVLLHDLGAVRMSRPWTVLAARRRLKRLLRDRAIDVVVCHANWPYVVFAAAVRSAGVRLVTCAHDTLTTGHWINRWAARTPPDLVLANSRYTKSTVPNVFPGVPVELSYYPVYSAAEQMPEVGRVALRSDLATPADDVVILQASRLEPWKGAKVLAETLGRLAAVPGWSAWLAGGVQKPEEAAFLDELRSIVVRGGVADRVRFLGHRTDVPRLLTAADIHCQPNTGGEPFGIVFIEALAAGLPVVTTAIGGGAEIVTMSCGVLVPPNDPAALAVVLGELIADRPRRERLGAGGPARARELCDPTVVLPRLARLIAAVPRSITIGGSR